jgi:hypothetical protein
VLAAIDVGHVPVTKVVAVTCRVEIKTAPGAAHKGYRATVGRPIEASISQWRFRLGNELL